MAQEVIMPKLGLTMTEGKITRWLKKEGEHVSVGEPIVEIETDKINSEVESPLDGYVLKILAEEGEDKGITVPICILGDKNELSTYKNEISEPGNEDTARIFITPIARKLSKENKIDYKTIKGTGPIGRIVKADILKAISEGSSNNFADTGAAARVFITPLAKKMAEENGIDIATVKATGPEGRIVKEDILAKIEARSSTKAVEVQKKPEAEPASVSYNVSETSRRVELKGMRKVIAQRLSQSKHDIPHVYFKANIDATRIIELKDNVSGFVKAKTNRKLSINEIIIKAVAAALQEYKDINVSLIGNEIVYHDSINIGMAVSVENGLMVPVIKDADKLCLSELNKIAGDLATRAREGKLKLDEMSGGTFTVSNLGAYGIDEFSAIINPPESAILAVGAIAEVPWVENGEIVIRKRMNLTLSVDHRVIDGALAAEFMKKLREILENPYLLLI